MLERYIERIRQVYPELSIENYKLNENGQNNTVVIVNDSIVFRFPKYAKGMRKLKEEKELVERIRPCVSIQIPAMSYQSFEVMEVGKVFCGYPMIEGMPLSKGTFAQVKEDDAKRKLASQLVAFLEGLHSIPTDHLKGIFAEENLTPSDEMARLYSGIKEKLFPFMRMDAKREVAHFFEAFLSSTERLNDQQVLIHGDFGATNIIWNPDTCEIAGIIDFGGSRLGDPAYDFAGLLSSYGKDFYQLCIRLYSKGDEVSERVAFYRKTFALQEALHGIDHHDKQAFEAGMKDYI